MEGNASAIAQWAVRSAPRAYAVKAGVTAWTWWALHRMACHRPRLAFWMVTALNTLHAVVVSNNYRVGSRLLAAR